MFKTYTSVFFNANPLALLNNLSLWGENQYPKTRL